MSIAGVQQCGKVDSRINSQSSERGAGSLVEMAEGIGELIERAAREETSLRVFERDVLDRLLTMGHAATEQFLAKQGDGEYRIHVVGILLSVNAAR
jgi:hypothetical protein